VLIETKLLTQFKIQALTDEFTLSALATKAIQEYLNQTEGKEQAPRKLLRRHPQDHHINKADKE